jgi:hypothetical protein
MADAMFKSDVEAAAAIPEIWSSAFYPTLVEKLPFASSVATDYQGEIRQLGDTVNITSFPQFDEAEEILEGQAVEAEATTLSNIQLIINKQLAKDFIITRKADIQSLEIMNALRDLALHSVLKKMQKIIIAAIVPSTSPDHTIAFDSGTTLQLADILEAKELLDNSDVEEAGRQMILGAAQWNDLFNIAGVVSSQFGASGSLSSGQVTAPIMGFQGKWTSEVGNVSYFMHPLAIEMAVQQDPTPSVHDLGAQGIRGTRVNMEVLFGLKQASDLRVVTIG